MIIKFVLPLVSLIILSSFISKLKVNVPAEARKLALIVAIGNYDQKTGWQQISSQNDVPLVKAGLLKLGFFESDIATLIDGQADRKGILAALAALEQKAQAGDVIVIHFSSHGQQITDDNSDEVDGFDEAIVAFGAPVNDRYHRSSGGSGPYDGSLHVRDEELGSKINLIRSKIGKDGHVLTFLDACHSATGTRGSSLVRGGEEPFDIGGPDKKRVATAKGEEGGFGLIGEGTKSRGSEDMMGKFILVSGASAHEINYETSDDSGKGVGSLSYCLSKVLSTMPKGLTYRAMFARVLSEMANRAPKQTPQLEGDVDFELFGGKYVAQEKYFTVIEIISDTELKINAGKLMNVFDGTPFSFERAGGALSKNPEAKGTVVSATNFDAVIKLDKPIKLGNKVDVWAYKTGAVLLDKKIKVNIDTIAAGAFKTALEKAIKGMAIAEVVKGKSDLAVADSGLRKSGKTRSVSSTATNQVQMIASAFGSLLAEKSISTADIENGVKYFTDLIQNYSQGKMFLDLDLQDPFYSVKISRIIPAKGAGKDVNDLDSIKNYLDKGNMLNIPAGKSVFVEVTNEGSEVAYFNIIDIEPSGKINPLLPKFDGSNTLIPELNSLRLNPGQSKIIPVAMKVSPPYGIEIMKVISTGKPFDLASTIVIPNYISSDGIEIQKVLKGSKDAHTSRGVELQQGEMGTNTYEFVFKIVK